MENLEVRLREVWGDDPTDFRKALDWIRSAVTNQREEDLYLEFKRKSQENTPVPDDADRGQLGKAISGFGNTDGGLLIWGVYARRGSKYEPDVASELRPIRGLKTFGTRLRDMAGGAANPPLPGVDIRLVPEPNNDDTGYVVTIVPKRRDTLTQATTNKEKGFFIRTGSGFYELPHALIAEFFNRRPSPLLRTRLEIGPLNPEEVSAGHLTLSWRLLLRNEGSASARFVVGEFHQPKKLRSRRKALHPTQEITVAEGRYYLDVEKLSLGEGKLEVSGQIYAMDSAPCPVCEVIPGAVLKDRYINEFETILSEKTKVATKDLLDSARRLGMDI